MPSVPWRGTFSSNALAVAKISVEDPLFEGSDGPKRTASLLLAIQEYESGYKTDAIGDAGRSKGRYQIQTAHDWRDDVQTTLEAIRLIRVSFKMCGVLPQDERLSAYASGTCDSEAGRRLSRHRFSLAKRLYSME